MKKIVENDAVRYIQILLWITFEYSRARGDIIALKKSVKQNAYHIIEPQIKDDWSEHVGSIGKIYYSFSCNVPCSIYYEFSFG